MSDVMNKTQVNLQDIMDAEDDIPIKNPRRQNKKQLI
jgi:hypothetical protein